MSGAGASADARGSDARKIAAMLTQAWRDRPSPPTQVPESAHMASLLVRSGSAPLFYRRIQSTAQSAVLASVRDASRMSHLHAVARTDTVARVVRCFREDGIEALIGKGWGVATRFYPEPSLRPSTDVDLFVAQADYDRACAVFRRRVSECGAADLHRGCPELSDRHWRSLWDARVPLVAGETPVWTFSDEHHLRLLALHFAKHGGFRVLWLCDIAAVVERTKRTLDWDEVLRGARWRSTWVLALIAVARDLLGADVAETPAEHVRVPHWLTQSLLHEWETPYRWPDNHPPAASSFLRGGFMSAMRELRLRWPSPVEASFNFGGAVNDFPRLPYQLLQLARQSVAIPRQLMQSAGRGRRDGRPSHGSQ